MSNEPNKKSTIIKIDRNKTSKKLKSEINYESLALDSCVKNIADVDEGKIDKCLENFLLNPQRFFDFK